MDSTDLTVHPIPTLMRKLAVPASVGFFFNTMYNVVDTYFAGLISTQALAALSLSFPVFFIVIALGSGLSGGATAVIANALGAADRRETGDLSRQTMTLAVILGAVVTVIGLASSPALFRLLGAGDVYLHDCLTYMDTIFAGTVFFLLAYACNAILTATGDTRSFRNFLIVGFAANAILDPWFIFGGLAVPAMGIFGLAFSTVLIELVGTIYLAARVWRTGILSARRPTDFLPRAAPMATIIRQGLPAGLSSLTIGLGIFVIIYFISAFGKEAVAAYGIGVRIEQIVLLPAIGLSTATLTLVAQNNGAGLHARIKQTLATALWYGGICMALGGLAVFILAPACMRVFTPDPAVVAVGARYLRIDALALFAYIILGVCIAGLQGVKRPGFAVAIGLLRQAIAPGLVFFLLTKVLHLGLTGIWWAICIITWAAALITALYFHRLLKSVFKAS